MRPPVEHEKPSIVRLLESKGKLKGASDVRGEAAHRPQEFDPVF